MQIRQKQILRASPLPFRSKYTPGLTQSIPLKLTSEQHWRNDLSADVVCYCYIKITQLDFTDLFTYDY